MKEDIDRGVYCLNQYLPNIINSLDLVIKDLDFTVTLNVRILNKDTARLHVNAINSHGWRKTYDFPLDIEIAKVFLNVSESDINQKSSTYHIIYEGNVAKVVQYEPLKDGKVRLAPHKQPSYISDQLIVLQSPVIEGPTECQVDTNLEFTVSSKVQTKEDSLITAFIVCINDKQTQYFVFPYAKEVTNTFYIYLDPSKYKNNQVIPLTVIVVDNERHSNSSTKLLTVKSGVIAIPEIIKPEHGAYTSLNSIEIQGTPFVTYNDHKPHHIATTYRITKDIQGKIEVFSCKVTDKNILTHYVVKLDKDLEYSESYYAWIKYEDEIIGESEWSKPRQFTVKDDIDEKVEVPKITGPYLVYNNNSYEYQITSKSFIGASIKEFIVTYKDETFTLKATNNKATLSISIVQDDVGRVRLITAKAIDDENNTSFLSYQEIICLEK